MAGKEFFREVRLGRLPVPASLLVVEVTDLEGVGVKLKLSDGALSGTGFYHCSDRLHELKGRTILLTKAKILTAGPRPVIEVRDFQVAAEDSQAVRCTRCRSLLHCQSTVRELAGWALAPLTTAMRLSDRVEFSADMSFQCVFCTACGESIGNFCVSSTLPWHSALNQVLISTALVARQPAEKSPALLQSPTSPGAVLDMPLDLLLVQKAARLAATFEAIKRLGEDLDSELMRDCAQLQAFF